MENYVNAIKRHTWLIILGYSLFMSVILYVAEEELVYQGLEGFRLPRNSFGMVQTMTYEWAIVFSFIAVNMVGCFVAGLSLR